MLCAVTHSLQIHSYAHGVYCVDMMRNHTLILWLFVHVPSKQQTSLCSIRARYLNYSSVFKRLNDRMLQFRTNYYYYSMSAFFGMYLLLFFFPRSFLLVLDVISYFMFERIFPITQTLFKPAEVVLVQFMFYRFIACEYLIVCGVVQVDFVEVKTFLARHCRFFGVCFR